MGISLGILDLIAVAFTAAMITAVGIGASYMTPRRPKQLRRKTDHDDIAFLLEGEYIIDLTSDAAMLLSQAGFSAPYRDLIIAVLESTLGDLQQTLDEGAADPVVLSAIDGSSSWLNIVPAEHTVRITVSGCYDANITQINASTLVKENTELAVLRDVVKNAPTMMWRCNEKGQLIGANDAYFYIADAHISSEIASSRLSNTPLFSDLDGAIGLESTQARKSLTATEQDTPRWFDIITHKSKIGAFHYAKGAGNWPHSIRRYWTWLALTLNSYQDGQHWMRFLIGSAKLECSQSRKTTPLGASNSARWSTPRKTARTPNTGVYPMAKHSASLAGPIPTARSLCSSKISAPKFR